jgi:hypothetical protein
VRELVGIRHSTQRLHEVFGDVERDRDDEHPLGIEEQRARLTVDLGEVQSVDPQAPTSGGALPQEPRNALAPVDRARERERLPTAVRVGGDIGGKEIDQLIDVALADRSEEPAGELLAPCLGGFEPRPPGLDPTATRSPRTRSRRPLATRTRPARPA